MGISAERTAKVDAEDVGEGMRLKELHDHLAALLNEHRFPENARVYAGLHFGKCNKHGSNIMAITAVSKT